MSPELNYDRLILIRFLFEKSTSHQPPFSTKVPIKKRNVLSPDTSNNCKITSCESSFAMKVLFLLTPTPPFQPPSLDYRRLQNFNDDMDHLYQRIKDILNHGLTICDRHYEFLAFSSSQLREHSCWMFTPSTGSVTADSIRTWMGDFSRVRPVAKYAARVSDLTNSDGRSSSTSSRIHSSDNRSPPVSVASPFNAKISERSQTSAAEMARCVSPMASA